LVFSSNTDGWISDISGDVVTKIHTEVFRNDMVSFNGVFVFSSGNVNVSESRFLLPRIRDIEEEPFSSRDISDLEEFDGILGSLLDSEGIGG